jgi:hypothetical protein
MSYVIPSYFFFSHITTVRAAEYWICISEHCCLELPTCLRSYL